MRIQDQKLVQLIAYFAEQSGEKQINKLKAIKLVWAADRYHIRKYGRLVSGDEYFAMKFGPVGSQLKSIAELDSYLADAYIEYAGKYIMPDDEKISINLLTDPDMDLLSQTDTEALDFAWRQFGDKSGFDLADYSHKFPEWIKFEGQLSSGEIARGRIDPLDFFENPSELTDDPFNLEDLDVAESKTLFIENSEAESALAQ